MSIWPHVARFFAGAFLCNCIPHLGRGLTGRTLPTPFSRPPGIKPSSAVVNVLWGTANLFVGIGLVLRFPILTVLEPGAALFAGGFIVLGVYLARHFSTIERD
ncbi:MAG TPA: hypothetical protein VHD32_08890 [Candidatus Didemnitutus sp.]|nr:hypothetical protein [Candidatus Didemnitutus sp.]